LYFSFRKQTLSLEEDEVVVGVDEGEVLEEAEDE